MICAVGVAGVVLTPPGGAAPGEPALAAQARPHAYLKERKSLKYMGVQDQLAVTAAGLAIQSAGAEARVAGDRTGLYLAVGYIPFERKDIDPVLERSTEFDSVGQPAFSIERFSREGYQRAHPLLAFRCLPNMPAYHIAGNFGITGPYSVAYPGVGQLYMALEQAVDDLQCRRVDLALVGGVAHQRNFLVEHHMARGVPGVEAARLRDAASMLLLVREADAQTYISAGQLHDARAPLVALRELSVGYEPFDPLTTSPAFQDTIACPQRGAEPTWASQDDAGPLELGPASLGCALARHFVSGQAASPKTERDHKVLTHSASSRDGVRAESTWERLDV